MSQVDYVAAVWRRKWLVLAAVVLGAGGALAATLFTGATYRSTAVIKVMMTLPGALSGETDASGTGAQDFVTLVNQSAFRDEVVRKIAFGNTRRDGDEVSAEALQDPSLFTVSGISAGPQDSKRLADAAVELLKEKSLMLFAGPEDARKELETNLLEPLASEINSLRQQQQKLYARRHAAGRRGADKYTAQIDRMKWRISNLERSYASYSDYLSRVALDEAIGRQNLAVVSKPILPVRASRANALTNTAIGMLLGALLGIGVAVFMAAAGRSTLATSAPAATKTAAAAPPSSEARRPAATSATRPQAAGRPSGHHPRAATSAHSDSGTRQTRTSDSAVPRRENAE